MNMNNDKNPVTVGAATFKSIAQQQVHQRAVQKYKFNYTYQVNAIIEPAQTTPIILTITQDADFLFEKITGSVFGPVDTAGIPTQTPTDFPMPGIAVGQGFAGRGISVQIVDTGNTRDLTNGFIPVETLLSPGYGVQMYLPYPIKYFAERNSRIKFDFRNQDTQARQQVTIVINGYKYQMPEMPETLLVNQQVGGRAEVAS